MTNDSVRNSAVLDLDALRPGYTADPYPVLAELRQSAAARQVTLLGLRAWLVTRYDDVLAAFAHPDLSSDPQYASEQAQAWPMVAAGRRGPMAGSISTTDDPDHSRLRRLVAKEFTPRRVEALRPRIEAICDDLIAGFRSRGSVDLIHEFAALLPLTIISDMFGLPEQDRERFRRWTLIIGGVDQASVAEQPRAWADTGAYLTQLIDNKSRADRPAAESDLLAALIAVRDSGDRLSHSELVAMATVLLLAGHATTVNLIANTVLELVRRPEHLAAVREDPDLIEAVIEETLRHDGPVVNPNLRYTRKEVRIGDTTIPANEVVILSIAAADRDPDRFSDPDAFDPARAGGAAHLGFGHGVHYCIGAPLARLESRIAIGRLLAACPDLALAEGEELQWRIGLPGRALLRLPLTFTPRATT